METFSGSVDWTRYGLCDFSPTQATLCLGGVGMVGEGEQCSGTQPMVWMYKRRLI